MMRQRLLGLLLALGVAVLVSPADVRAHAELVTATPFPEAVLDTPPSGVTLVFTQDLARASSVSVVGPNGQVGGGATIAGNTATAPVPQAGPGRYTVRWTSVSVEDGHEKSDSYQFVVAGPTAGGDTRPVGQSAGAQAPGPAPAPAALRPAQPAPATAARPAPGQMPRAGVGATDQLPTSLAFIIVAGGFALAGASVVALRRRQNG